MTRSMRIINLALSIGLVITFMLAVVTIGPALETRLYPVYSKFQIFSIKETADGGTEVIFRYEKLRSCPPAGVTWFIGDPGGAYRQVDFVSNRPPMERVNRSLGENTSVPYKIDVAPAVLINQGFATIYNNCHPFWVTRSVIYP